MATEKPTDYVQFYTTRVEPAQSQGDIIGVLHRYGASGFGFRRRGDVIEVTFHLTTDGDRERSVCIPVSVDRVFAKLRGAMAEKAKREKQAQREDLLRAQAERVAWRVLLQWINASLSAVAIGAQTVEEAFYAHTIVESTDGQTGRLIDYVHSLEDTTAESQHTGRGILPALGRPIVPREQLALPPGTAP